MAGDSGQRLGDPEFYERLPVPDVEFGVIAGDFGQSFTFDEPNDTIVALRNTRLDGMKDWIALRRSHSFLTFSRRTADLCVRFLEQGSFGARDKAEADDQRSASGESSAQAGGAASTK